MALPVSNAADRDEDLIHEFDMTGYAQLPVEHLSDSSENSLRANGTSDDLTYSTGRLSAISQQTGNSASTQNANAVAHINSGAPYQNGHGHVADIDGMENGGHVVHIDGMEIHVYGQLAGLQLTSQFHHSHDDEEDDDDVDESERQREEDSAIRRAMEEDEARRLAPLPPDRCQVIKNAMQNISLSGFRPEWAEKVPEEQWVNRLRKKSMSKFIITD